MSGLDFVDIQQGKDALQDVRSDASSTDWCLFSYENAKSNRILLIGKGSGGVQELLESLKDDIIGFALVRKTEKIDESITGEQVPRMQKARLSVHQGAMKQFIGQFHVDLTVSNKSELSDEIVQQKITETSGTASRVVNKATGAREATSSSYSSGAVKSGGPKSSALEFANESELKDAIRDVRVGDEKNWVLATYEGGDSNTIVIAGSGSGGADELAQNLRDDIVGYGLVKMIEQIDETKATKFAFIKFQGNDIPRMLKARLGTHMGKITEVFHPYHVTIDATQISEISDEIVMKTIKNASGTSVHVLAEENVPKSSSSGITTAARSSNYKPVSSNATKQPVVPKSLSQEQTIKIDDQAREDIKAVRNDSSGYTWCLSGYEGKKGNNVVALGKGTGGVDELLALLEDDMVGYGLVRKVEQIDDSKTVKFVHINFVGENINRMHRARLGTHKGAPYHVDINATQKSELSDDILMQRIAETSGRANKVKP